MSSLDILVRDLQPGDIWVGNDNVEIHEVDHVGGVTVMVPPDYRAAQPKIADQIEMKLIRFQGTILSGDDRGFTGWWSLRPDQIVEVLRAQ